MKQRLVISCQTNHCFVYGGIAVRVELHRLSYDICALRSSAGEKTHFIHSIKELSVRGLEAVYFGNSTRYDNAHSVRHIVINEGLGYRLLGRSSLVCLQVYDVYFLFSCHFLIRHNLIILCAAALIILL